MTQAFKEPLRGLNILITGGCGFIGSHLTERLCSDNVVTVLDNCHSSNNERFDGVEYVFASTELIGEIFHGRKFDLIYHLGEYARVEQSILEFDKVVDLNFRPLPNVLKFVKSSGAKLIYSGSSTRFYDHASGENLSPYTFSKSVNAKFVKNFATWYGIDWAICYFYNVYGGREISTGNYSTVVARFLEAYKKNECVNITAPGTQERNFTHVDDTIDALLVIGSSGSGDDYCIAHPRSVSIVELADSLKLKYSYAQPHPSNRMSGPIPSRKLQELNWKPKIDIFDYLREKM